MRGAQSTQSRDRSVPRIFGACSMDLHLFDRTEYLERIGRVKRQMTERGIDLLLVASPANQFWLTGYDGWSFYTPQMVAVSLAAEEPVWIGRKMDAVGAKFTAFLAPENVVPYPDYYVGSSEHHPMQFV